MHKLATPIHGPLRLQTPDGNVDIQCQSIKQYFKLQAPEIKNAFLGLVLNKIN